MSYGDKTLDRILHSELIEKIKNIICLICVSKLRQVYIGGVNFELIILGKGGGGGDIGFVL